MKDSRESRVSTTGLQVAKDFDNIVYNNNLYNFSFK